MEMLGIAFWAGDGELMGFHQQAADGWALVERSFHHRAVVDPIDFEAQGWPV
jgi:hypothetical protein